MLTGRRCGGTCDQVAAVEQDLAGVRASRSRRSSAASWSCRSPDGPSSEKNSPAGDVEVDAADRGDAAERLGQPDQLDRAAAHRRSASRPAAASRAKLATNRSTSASSCWTDSSHCSTLPHGGRKTPPLCCTSQCSVAEPVVDLEEVAVVAHPAGRGTSRSPWRRRRRRATRAPCSAIDVASDARDQPRGAARRGARTPRG